VWQGKSKEELGFTKNTGSVNIFPKDGESSQKLFNRAKNFLEIISLKHSKDCVLLVGHDGINKALIAAIIGKNSEGIRVIERQHNTGINIFEIDGDKNYKIVVFNSIKHLN